MVDSTNIGACTCSEPWAGDPASRPSCPVHPAWDVPGALAALAGYDTERHDFSDADRRLLVAIGEAVLELLPTLTETGMKLAAALEAADPDPER